MVIYYLQTEAVLPSIRKLQENINEEKALTVGRKYFNIFMNLKAGTLTVLR